MNWYKKAQTQSYQTKDGQTITFKEFPFNENTDKRGWIVHKIDAYVNGEYAGYINLSYIPKEKWEEIYRGNIWRFRRLALGHFDISDELIDAGDEAIAKKYQENCGWISDSKSYMQKEKEKAEEEYKLYQLYFVDKPIVDFIRTEAKFQRQRIAYALHQYASQWLKNNFGLRLWLSYCRTDMGKCFYNSKLMELKKYKYRHKMTGGFRQTREYIANNKSWYKKAQTQRLSIWLSDEINRITHNFQYKPSTSIAPTPEKLQENIEDVRTWAAETNPDLSNYSLSKAIDQAIIYKMRRKYMSENQLPND